MKKINTFKRNKHEIDATNKIAGRLASQVAILLMGKHRSGYRPNLDLGDFVEISNIEKMKFSGKKLENKIYYRTSGYPGGITPTPMKKIYNQNPSKLFMMIVKRMLPNNKLRVEKLKRLIFKK